jgi:hypothetical protein
LALTVLGTTVWVVADANQRDWRGNRFADATWKWVLGCLLLWIVVFPIYLVQRTRVQADRSSNRPRVSAHRAEKAPAIFWWGMLSAAAMIVGGFGPWATLLGVSVSGTDGDGWIIIVLAAFALLCVLGEHQHRVLALLSLIAGVTGVAITLYDRSNLTSAVDEAGAFGALAQVGWGLNLALAASASLAIHAVVAATRASRRANSVGARARHPSVVPLPFQTGALATAPVAPAASTLAQATAPSEAVAPPAGWYVDPDDGSRLRYWGGSGWSSRTATTNDP